MEIAIILRAEQITETGGIALPPEFEAKRKLVAHCELYGNRSGTTPRAELCCDG